MVDFNNAKLYKEDSIDKQLKITFDSGTITNSDIPSEQFELTESLSSDSQLVFGSCEASEIKFRIYNVFLPLKDKWLTVTQTLNGDTENPLQIGKYKVYSDKPTADRGYRDVVAYDAMYDIINTDVASWYNSLTFPMSLKAFRDSFFAFFGIEQENVSLVNDSMEIERTIDVQVLSGRDVIQSICQLNGCFGHIARNGKFKYVFLKSIMGGLYPSNDIYPANDLFPQQPNVQIVGSGLYVDTPTYEDYTVKPIEKLQIRQKEGDIGVIVGNGDNTYIVEDNFLVYGKSTEDLTVIANNMLSVIDGLEYRPFDATLVGNPCIEVGDMVRLHTKYQLIDSYVLQRTLSGVQCLRDNFVADGEEYQSEKVNDIQTDIKQLKGKSNTLERTLEETKSTITDMEKGLQSEITQTAESITSAVSKTYETKSSANTTKKELQSSIEQTAESITSAVAKAQNKWDISKLSFTITLFGYENPQNVYPASEQYANQYYLNQTTGLISKCRQNSPTSYVWMGELQATTIEASLSSEIEQTAESIRLEVSDVEKELSSEIETNANQIALKVSKGDVSSQLSVESDQVTISGNRLVVDATNFSLSSDGKMSCNEAEITGTIKGSSGEFTKGFNVDIPYNEYVWLMKANENGFYTGSSISGGSGSYEDFYSLLEINRTNANLYGHNGVAISGGKGGVTISGTSPTQINNGLSVSGSVSVTDNVQSPGVIMASHVRPMNDGGSYCGVASYKWKDVYSQKSSNNTSDRNLKHDITPISSVYEDLFFKMKPVSYMFNTGDRKHWGFISQDLEEAMNELGLTSEDCAAFCKDIKVEYFVDENGNTVEKQVLDEEGNPQYIYGIRYGEFTPLNTHMIQQAYKKIETQQQEIDTLKEQVSFLMQKLGDDVNG